MGFSLNKHPYLASSQETRLYCRVSMGAWLGNNEAPSSMPPSGVCLPAEHSKEGAPDATAGATARERNAECNRHIMVVGMAGRDAPRMTQSRCLDGRKAPRDVSLRDGVALVVQRRVGGTGGGERGWGEWEGGVNSPRDSRRHGRDHTWLHGQAVGDLLVDGARSSSQGRASSGSRGAAPRFSVPRHRAGL